MNRSLGAVIVLLAGCATDTASSPPQNRLTPQQTEEGWMLLFDGESLNGWTNRGGAEWAVEDGNITVAPGSGPGHLASNQIFGDFRLQLDFYADAGSSSGILLRAPTRAAITADNVYQLQLFNPAAGWETPSGTRAQPVTEALVRPGEWNSYDITLVGPQLTVLLNGRRVVDAAGPPRVESGLIIIAPAETDLRFRNIRIQPLNCFACAHPSTYN